MNTADLEIERIIRRRGVWLLACLVALIVLLLVRWEATGLRAGRDDARIVLDRTLIDHMRLAAGHIVPAGQLRGAAPQPAPGTACADAATGRALADAASRISSVLGRLSRKTDYAFDLRGFRERNPSIGCAEAARAIRHLAFRRLLEQAYWEEKVKWLDGEARVVRVEVTLPDYLVALPNPWGTPGGCVFARASSERGGGVLLAGSARVCAEALAQGPLRGQSAEKLELARPEAGVVPQLHTFLNPMSDFTGPEMARADNTFRYRHHDVRIGHHLELTLDLRLQKIAQQIAGCLTGQGSCEGIAAAIDLDQLKALFEEGALVRAIGIAIVGRSGRILSAASSHSACYEREARRLPPSSECPNSELGDNMQAWRAETNRAEIAHKLASWSKVCLLGALAESPNFGGLGLTLAEVIRHAATSAPNDWFERLATCGFGNRNQLVADCPLARRYVQLGRDLGWQEGCIDPLFGSRLPCKPGNDEDAARRAAFMQAFVRERAGKLEPMDPAGAGSSLAPYALYAEARSLVARGALSPGRVDKWVAARGFSFPSYEKTRDLSLNAVGHGNATGSPLGIAWTMAAIGHWAREGGAIRLPHLVERVYDARGNPVPEATVGAQPVEISPALSARGAKTLESFLGHVADARLRGTAWRAWRDVYGKACTGPCVVGKTGTVSDQPIKHFGMTLVVDGEPLGVGVTIERGIGRKTGGRDGENRAALAGLLLKRAIEEGVAKRSAHPGH